MNVDALRELSNVFRSRDFPKNSAFNLCYFNKVFEAGDLSKTSDGRVYDFDMQSGEDHIDVFNINGKAAPTDWCGTVACVAGMTVLLFGPNALENKVVHESLPTSIKAQIILGLTNDEAEQLFTPSPSICSQDWATITPEHVADVIDNFIESSHISWNKP